jgi:hypothetical protein
LRYTKPEKAADPSPNRNQIVSSHLRRFDPIKIQGIRQTLLARKSRAERRGGIMAWGEAQRNPRKRLIANRASQELTMDVLTPLEGRCWQRPLVFGRSLGPRSGLTE